MSEFIRESLGWIGGPWPPDFYALLGFSSHIVNADEVESAVLFRMEKLRAYQLIQPESVTEAMNLLARALITLSDPAAKAEYDRQLEVKGQEADDAGQRSPDSGRESGHMGQDSEGEEQKSRVAEQGFAEVPIPHTLSEGLRELAIPLSIREGLGEGDSSPTKPLAKPPSTDPLPLIPLEPTPASPALPPPLPIRIPTAIERSISGEWLPAQERHRPKRYGSLFRRRDGAGRDRIRWIVRLRQLLRAWDEAGDWLAIPDLAFATRIEAVNLIIALRTIVRFAPDLVESTGPGSAVRSLAESRPSSTTLMEITDVRRQFLAKDWRAGRAEIFDAYWHARQQLNRRRQSRGFQKTWTRHATTVMLTLLVSSMLIIVVWRAVRG